MMMRSRNTLGVNERDYDDEIEDTLGVNERDYDDEIEEYLRRKRERL